MSTVVWVDGAVRPAAQARVGALDHGLTVGDGVFETCKVRAGEAFALTRHLRRLRRSAAVLELPVPPDDELRAAVAQTLAAAGAGAGEPALGRLRITVTGGAGPLGSDRGEVPPTLVVAVAPARPWPAEIAVHRVAWPRNERSAVAGAKTTSYAENVVALAEAHRHGAQEALLANTRGELCEGTGSNVVVAVDDVLRTPPLSSGCLAGITRELFLEWAAEDGLTVLEEVLPFGVLDRAEDVLLLSSTRDVQPVTSVDGRSVRPTALAQRASALFAKRAAEGMDP